MVTPAVKREAVAHLRSAFDMSKRRACRTINCARMTMRYRSRRPDDTELRQRLRALAHERRRFGYRRLHVLLRREGFKVNHKRLFRLYREERLTVRRRGGRKRAFGTRGPMLVPQLPNERWSLVKLRGNVTWASAKAPGPLHAFFVRIRAGADIRSRRWPWPASSLCSAGIC
jgi:putative transposase